MSDTLVVFSHPNHEVAVFGLLQRWRPALLYLTDGGGADRVAQTEQGLRSIGLLDRATFLNKSEASFYQALLDVDQPFFDEVAEKVAEADHLQTETFVPASLSSDVDAEFVLRYEWRADVLRRHGAIERAITHGGHFLPIARALAGEVLDSPSA